MGNHVLAADVGGTNIRIGIVNNEGTISSRSETGTPSFESPENIAMAIARLAEGLVNDLPGEQKIATFGLAIPAVIDFETGRISRSPNLPQLNTVEFGKMVAAYTGINIVLGNDATAAAIGEHWLGAGRGAENVVCITLGTGVGGGLIINRAPYYGSNGSAGEIGHICVEPEGPLCGCGSRGCLEQFASATAIVRLTKERIRSGGSSTLVRLSEFTAEDVYDAATAGDELSLSVFEKVGYYLGIALADVVNVLNPELIVITGGAASSWPLFIEQAMSEMRARAFQQPVERVKIVPGRLGDDAGILGAAKMALDL